MNTFGLVVGLVTLLIIGIGFVWVIRGEWYFGYLWWPYVLVVGILLVIISAFIENDWGSVFTGILGASVIWGSTEFKEQAIRAELGWFPYKKDKIDPPFAKKIQSWTAPHF